MLGERYPLPCQPYRDVLPVYPDIEEDRGLAEEEVRLPVSRAEYTYDEAKLLYTPLPRDLPTLRSWASMSRSRLITGLGPRRVGWQWTWNLRPILYVLL